MNELPQNQQVDEKGGEIAQASPAADDPSETSIYPHPNKRIKEYLLEHVSDYRRLDKLRRQGWENPEGDRFFEKQRKNADEPNAKTQRHFYDLMLRIAEEMQKATAAFTVPGQHPKRILDCCMAPGAYLQTALAYNPSAEALAFSLPPAEGGHKVLLKVDNATHKVTTKLLDLTMLAADMDGATAIPETHPDAAKFFREKQVGPGQLFDLVLCDGQLLRTHAPHRAAYRETREARRLILSQLALGVEHIRPGGIMVVLGHRVEGWETVCLLRKFSRIAERVRLFKPVGGHAKRSSFYMVVTGLRGGEDETLRTVEKWKEEWRAATFASEEEWRDKREAAKVDAAYVDELLEEFGPELVRLGVEGGAWRIQADALEKAPFVRKQMWR